MKQVAVPSLLVAAAFGVFLAVGVVAAIPAEVGFAGGILLFVAFLMLRQLPLVKPHRALVTSALVLTVVASLLVRGLLRQDIDAMDIDEYRNYLMLSYANDTLLTLAPFLALFVPANLLERGLLGLAIAGTAFAAVMTVVAFDAYMSDTGSFESMQGWAMLGAVVGNAPVLLAGILLCVRSLMQPQASAAAATVGTPPPATSAPIFTPTGTVPMGRAGSPPAPAPATGPVRPATPSAAPTFVPAKNGPATSSPSQSRPSQSPSTRSPATPTSRPTTAKDRASPSPRPASITCPRCATSVARPAKGPPRCPTCSYPGPDSRTR